jgi:SAM-dependent methyltransferase
MTAGRLTRDQIIEGYRLFFDRDPESEAIIESYIVLDLELWQFLRVLADSAEARRCQVDKGSQLFIEQANSPIQAEATPDVLAELMASTKTAWSGLGETDVFWSVLTEDEYRKEAFDETARKAFYGSGEAEFADFAAACRRNGVAIDPGATVLELGCGVGRISEHLARRFQHYIGVDISPSHLRIAGEHLSSLGLENVELLALEDFLKQPPSFDILYTILTLQHNAPPVILMLLRTCLSRLRPGGRAFFQLPCHLYDYDFDAARHAAQSPDEGMEMHALPQAHVFRALAENGLVPVEVIPYPRIGPIGFSFAFLAVKPLSPERLTAQAT